MALDWGQIQSEILGKLDLFFLLKGCQVFAERLLDCRIHGVSFTSNPNNVNDTKLSKHHPLFQLQSAYTDTEPGIDTWRSFLELAGACHKHSLYLLHPVILSIQRSTF
jgi:hypothetical protein